LFSGCSGLTSVTLPSAATAIGISSFYKCSSLQIINIPVTLKTIGVNAFSDCTSLTNVSIPSTVTTIGNYAFTNCSASLVVDNANTKYSSQNGILFNLDKSTIIQCPITISGDYSIPETVKAIGAYSFYNCSKLTSVYIPVSVPSTGFGDGAFFNCSGLTSIFVPSRTPADLSNSLDVFYNVDKANCILNVPIGTKLAYQAANQWSEFSKIVEVATGVDSPLKNTFTVASVNGQLIISGLEVGKTIEIYNLQGVLVKSQVSTSDSESVNLPTKGIYIVRIGKMTEKILNN